MSIADLLKNVSVADLTAYARAIPSPADFLLTQTVFAETQVNDVKWRIKQTKRRVNAASYRAYDASVPFAKRQAETLADRRHPSRPGAEAPRRRDGAAAARRLPAERMRTG